MLQKLNTILLCIAITVLIAVGWQQFNLRANVITLVSARTQGSLTATAEWTSARVHWSVERVRRESESDGEFAARHDAAVLTVLLLHPAEKE